MTTIGTTGAPQGGQMMPAGNIFDVLGAKDSIYIKQVGTGRECLEMITDCEMSNRFNIGSGHDDAEQPLFTMNEDSNCCVRQLCKNIVPFEMNLNDRNGTPQIKYVRPFHCTNSTNCMPCCYLCNCCAYDCCCGTQALEINTVGGEKLGQVLEEQGSWCGLTKYCVYDSENKPRFVCLVPCCELCKMCCCQDVDLVVLRCGDGDNDNVATITRPCVCDCTNVATDKDHFNVKFEDTSLKPLDKFYIMSLIILVKYMHFEQGGDN